MFAKAWEEEIHPPTIRFFSTGTSSFSSFSPTNLRYGKFHTSTRTTTTTTTTTTTMIKTGPFYSFFQSHSFLGKWMDGSLGKESWAWVGWVRGKEEEAKETNDGMRGEEWWLFFIGDCSKISWMGVMDASKIEWERARQREGESNNRALFIIGGPQLSIMLQQLHCCCSLLFHVHTHVFLFVCSLMCIVLDCSVCCSRVVGSSVFFP